VALARLHQQRQERARGVVDAAPAHAERLLPQRAIAGDEAAAATDAGVVEQQVDVIDLARHRRGKRRDLRFVRDVGDERDDLRAVRLAELPGHFHRRGRDVAHCDVTAFGRQLTRQLPSHARPATSDDRRLALEVFHAGNLTP
jgi:hypothetical protein